jgi:RNA polymerase-binding transcription factor DksA
MATATAGPRKDLNIKHFRKLLDDQRSTLEEQLRKLDAQDETGGPKGEMSELAGYDQHPADQATELFLREQDQAIGENLRGELALTEAAARKLDDGTFGYCERCSAEIPKARLEVLPFARFCMDCAQDLEGR